ESGGVINDPILLRVADDEFWFSISDSDVELWLRGINIWQHFDVDIQEIDVAPVQVQGPKSVDLMTDLFGEEVDSIPFFGIMSATLADHDVLISQTGFSGEKGYEIYLYDAYKYADDLWNAILQAGKKTPVISNRTDTSSPYCRRHSFLGPGHGPGDPAFPSEPGLPSATA